MEGARALERDGRPLRHAFDEHGHLTPLLHQQVRERLNATGHWSAMQQSALLARQLDHPDQDEIWALLMWNARPGKPLAAKLHWWLSAGMPLADGAPSRPTARGPLARAS